MSGPLARFFWLVVDELDYWLTLARLRIVDSVCGPEPETPADRQRNLDREELERALQGSHEPARKGDFHPKLQCNIKDVRLR